MIHFADQDLVRLMLGDTDAIKAYVFETSVLPEIRGGSDILVGLEKEIGKIFRQEFPNDCYLVYCGGGGFLAIVRSELAESLQQRIERLYLDTTTLATITIVYSEPVPYGSLQNGLPLPDGVLLDQLTGQGIAGELLASHFEAFFSQRQQRRCFGEWLAHLVSLLQRSKRQKCQAPFIETLPIHRRCDSCGKRPSAKYDETRGEEICTVCWQKRSRGRHARHSFFQRFEEWLGQEPRKIELRLKAPQSLKDLAEPEGRIALIYADGNNMGDVLQRARDVKHFETLSKALQRVTEDAVFEAIYDTLLRNNNSSRNSVAPFEIIALGGDDAVLVVPASAGWDVASKCVRKFEEHQQIQDLQHELGLKLNLSAGIAIADEKYPIRFLMELAQGLRNEAKRLARQAGTGTLCHLWLRAPIISEDAATLLQSLYQRKTPNGAWRLTARPYTWQEAEQLSQIVGQLKQLPKSQRRALAEALDKGLHFSINYALYQAARLSNQGLREAFEQTRDLLTQRWDREVNSNWFWVESPGQKDWQTALLDALELADLLPHPNKEAIE